MSIAKILENKPKGTRLYSLTNGDCFYDGIDYTGHSIMCKEMEGCTIYFSESGKFDPKGECLLYPSRRMKDWSKFSWKKGDVLIDSKSNRKTVFVKFIEGCDYTKFYGRYLFEVGRDLGNCEGKTEEFTICSKEESIRFIHEIEEEYNGKFNPNTLDVVNIPNVDFKNGDIIIWTYSKNPYIGIFNKFSSSRKEAFLHATLLIYNGNNILELSSVIDHHLEAFRYATEEEKQKILSALGKEGKVWNENTRTIEDVESECEFKPFDKVIVRNGNYDKWGIDLFSHYNNKNGLYYCLNGAWDSCLPYNEKTSKLINTFNSSSLKLIV